MFALENLKEDMRMKKWMYDCVLETPATAEAMFKNKEALVGKLVDLFLAKDYKKIVMVASGSSYNIANCSKYAIQTYLGVKVDLINSVTYAKYDYQFHENALVICMSQSGKSTNTIEAVIKAKECGNDVVAISMVPNSPITRYCDTVLEYGSYGPGDDVFVCRGVPTSTLYFILFALEAGVKKGVYPKDSYKKRMKEIETIIHEMPRIREKIDGWYDANKEELWSMKRAMTVGIGPSFGPAIEGALKMEETIGIPSNVYETEEFLHGPVYEIKKDNAVFLLDMDDKMHDRVMMIYEGLHQLTDRVYLITRHPGNSDKRVMTIDVDTCSLLLPMLFVMPFQILSSRVCDDCRINAITVYNYRFSQAIKTKAN